MNPRIRDQWADALESGEFRRTVGRLAAVLYGETCYCCLGVLTELYHRETGLGGWFTGQHEGQLEFHQEDETIHDAFLPEDVQRWAGLSTFDPRLEENEDEDKVAEARGTTAAGLNDSGAEFPQIAAAIRRMPAS